MRRSATLGGLLKLLAALLAEIGAGEIAAGSGFEQESRMRTVQLILLIGRRFAKIGRHDVEGTGTVI